MDYMTITNLSSDETVDTWEDWGVYIIDVSIPHAYPETNYITIEGSSGYIDMTEATGVIPYRTKEGSFTIVFPYDSNVMELSRKINTFLNGPECEMVLSFDDEYYYRCRFSLGTLSAYSYKKTLPVTIELIDPYKYTHNKGSIDMDITEETTITCVSGDKPVCPSFTCEAETTVVFGNVSTTISSDTAYINTAIVFTEGDNELTVTSSGNVYIEWEVGYLV